MIKNLVPGSKRKAQVMVEYALIIGIIALLIKGFCDLLTLQMKYLWDTGITASLKS